MIIKQLYKPSIKIPIVNYLYRFLSKLITIIFFLNFFDKLRNSLLQSLNSYISLTFLKENYFFKDGNERLLWRYKTQYYEELDLCKWIDTFKDNDVFYDIGANVGMFTIYAAKKNIKTYAFEPHASNLEILYYNTYLNKLNELIIIIPNALSSSDEVININHRDLTGGVAKNNIISNKINNKNYNLNFKTLSISLDNLITFNNFDYPNKIKIDVDGLEFEILNGGKKVINKADEIMLEMYENSTVRHKEFNNIIKIMKELNFKEVKKIKNNVYFKKINYRKK